MSLANYHYHTKRTPIEHRYIIEHRSIYSQSDFLSIPILNKIENFFLNIISRKPWATVAYALSPMDLIPVLGYLDDLIILSMIVVLTVKLIPREAQIILTIMTGIKS